MAVGLNSRPKEWSRPPEPHPPDAGCWCSRNKRRPDVSLIWCSTPSGHRNGLKLWIQTNGRKTALQPLNLTLDFEHAHVNGHWHTREPAARSDPKEALDREALTTWSPNPSGGAERDLHGRHRPVASGDLAAERDPIDRADGRARRAFADAVLEADPEA